MKWEKRIMQVQKGAVKMATGTMDSYPGDDVYIVPVGINYTDHTKFRSDALIKIGDPIRVEEYRADNGDFDNDSIDDMASEITRQQRELIIHIDKEENDEHANFLLNIVRNNRSFALFPKPMNTSDQLDDEIAAAKAFNLNEGYFKQKLDEYKLLLEQYRVPDISIAQTPGFWKWLSYGILMPFAFLGILLNYIPALVGELVARKTTSNAEFYSSVKIAVAGFSYWAYYFIIVAIAYLINLNLGLILSIVLPLLGLIALRYLDVKEKFSGTFMYAQLPKVVKEEMKRRRAAVLELLGK
jgi:hypothetical protein